MGETNFGSCNLRNLRNIATALCRNVERFGISTTEKEEDANLIAEVLLTAGGVVANTQGMAVWEPN